MALQAQLSQLSWYQSVLVVGVIYIILWVLSGVPNAFRDFRCRWILSRYPLVNPKWDTEAKRQFSSESQMALIKKGIAMVRFSRATYFAGLSRLSRESCT